MNKAVFLDRDGTINVERKYLYRIEDFEFLPGVIDALKMLQDAGYLLVLITNQSGIGRGYYTEEQYHELNKWMERQLNINGINFAASYYCPHHPNAQVEKYRVKCNCRKPKIGMYEEAIRFLNISIEYSYSIGDKLRDCAICNNTMCQGYLIGQTEEDKIIQEVKQGKIKNIQYAIDLKNAVTKILKI